MLGMRNVTRYVIVHRSRDTDKGIHTIKFLDESWTWVRKDWCGLHAAGLRWAKIIEGGREVLLEETCACIGTL